MKQKPLKKLNDGLITATIWVNKTEDGKERHSVTLLRSYLKDEKWHETASFGATELLRVTRLAQSAYDFIRETKTTEGKSEAGA